MQTLAARTEEGSGPGEEGRREQLAARIGGRFFLDTAMAVTDAFGGDLMRGIVLLTIMQQNAGDEGPIVEARPTTVYAVAKALGLNYETTRRYVGRLTDQGYCVRSPKGFLASPEIFERLEISRTQRRLVENLRAMNGRMREADLQGL